MKRVLFVFLFALLCGQAFSGENYAAQSSTLVVEGWKHRVWSLYPVEKLKAEQALPLTNRGDRVALTAARGEFEPFVLVLRSEVPLRKVGVTCGDLLGPGGATLSASSLTVQRLAYIYVDEPSGTRIKQPMPYETGTGEFPDPLLRDGGDARPNRNLQFLVTVRVPRETRAGAYTGTMKLHFMREGWMPADKETADTLPLTVVVRPFALPEASPLLNTCVASPQALTAWLQKPDTLAELHRDFAAHGQTPDPLPSPVVQISKDGALTVDSAAWEKAAAALLDEGRATHLFLPVWSARKTGEMQGVYFLWHYPAVTKQRWMGGFICDAQGELTAEFQRTFGAYLKHMHAVLARRGWLGRVYITTMDEPYTYHLHDETRAQDTPENNYRVIGNFVRFVRATAPGLKTFATADPAPALNGLIDHWCLRNLQHAAEARERAVSHGEVVTFCDNYRMFIDYPAVSARSLGWLTWRLGARGWLTYETLGSFTEAWSGPVFVYPNFSGGTVWGMGQLFYPAPSGSGYIAPSLRWELMREGCEDYAYLCLLRERVNGLPAGQHESAAAHAARELLATAADRVVGGTGDAETASQAPAPNAQSNRIPHDLRRRIGDLIEQLASP
jgi:hypothetical protein